MLHGAVVQLRTVALTPLALVTSYLTPLSIAVLVIASFGRPRLDLMVGAVAAAVMNALVVQTYFAITEERYGGTMQMHAASPAGLLAPLAGRLLGACAQGLVALPLTVALVLAIWGPGAVIEAVGRQSVVLAFAGLIMMTGGLLTMALVHMAMVVRTASYDGLVNAVFPVAVVAMGLFVPTSALPWPLRLVSYLLPPSWAMEAVRTDAYRPLLWCMATALGWTAAGLWLLRGLPSWLRTSPERFAQ